MTAKSPHVPDDLILDIRGLKTVFRTDDDVVNAVAGIDLQVERGTTTCIVGESGSGKSATARSIIQVVDRPGQVEGGQIWFKPTAGATPVDIAALDPMGSEIRKIRGKQIGLIFQEPMSSLSPVHTIGDQISEVLAVHEGVRAKSVRDRVIAELARVGIPRPEERIDAYTFQLSGGMRQRAMIAMALIARPELVIADEPTTALDVTTQAQILDLLTELKERAGKTMVFITHDLGVVAEIADNVVVMREGKVVETGPVDQLFHDPQHDYTRHLLSALPQRWKGNPFAGGAVDLAAPPPTLSRRQQDSPHPPPPPPPSRRQQDSPHEDGTPVTAPETPDAPILEIRDLTMRFDTVAGKLFGRKSKRSLTAVNDVSLTIPTGKTIGLVGESGCGKTTLGRAVLRAYQPTAGELNYCRADGTVVDLATLSQRELLPYRHDIRMVFQDPYGSLNPRMTVEQVIAEPLIVSKKYRRSEIHDRVHAALRRVGLQSSMAARYPHAFSGGERQRIGIARALITNPRLVVADEAVSALDTSVRTQVLELLAELQKELDLTFLFISHDLSIVEQICDEVAVMYFGEVVEHRPTAELFADPRHDYTRTLLSAVPIADPRDRGTKERRLTYRP
ncbi:ABC transporter ATP-binding protein [Georgenia sp. MJ173]|uniref:ABC transporter ATP-binding protein n=1 Tax=Georgenia sunbinii TaxID=3117728 RepID=UPI002F26BDEE